MHQKPFNFKKFSFGQPQSLLNSDTNPLLTKALAYELLSKLF
jgi:hypothetical protein